LSNDVPGPERTETPKVSGSPDAEGGRMIETTTGSVFVVRKPAHVALIVFKGRVGAELAARTVATLAELFRTNTRFHFLADLGDLDDYHSSLRVEAVALLKANLAKCISIQTFARSRIVSMGVAVANLALGGIMKNHPDRASLEIEMRRLAKTPP
jgi:hypothetical protein